MVHEMKEIQFRVTKILSKLCTSRGFHVALATNKLERNQLSLNMQKMEWNVQKSMFLYILRNGASILEGWEVFLILESMLQDTLTSSSGF